MPKFDYNEEVDYKYTEEELRTIKHRNNKTLVKNSIDNNKLYKGRNYPSGYKEDRLFWGNWYLYTSSPISLQLRDKDNKIIKYIYIYDIINNYNKCIKLVEFNKEYYEYDNFMKALKDMKEILDAIKVLMKYRLSFRFGDNIIKEKI